MDEWNTYLAFTRDSGQDLIYRYLVAYEATFRPIFERLLTEAEPVPETSTPLRGEETPVTEADRRVANVEALRVARRLGALVDPKPTREEVRALRKYTGWGGIKVDQVPLDPEAFSPEMLETLRAYQAANETGKIPPRIAGLQSQYFTPTRVCEAVWDVAARVRESVVGGLPAERALEPSAGVGRFLETAPDGSKWTAVEMDQDLVPILRLLHPNALVQPVKFEQWYTTVGSGESFDYIVGNPPYADRPRADSNLDGSGIRRAEDYFLDRCVSMLRPGGVLAFVTMASTMTSDNRSWLRRRILRSAHLATAVALPVDLFSGASVQTALVVLVGRASGDRATHALTVREESIVAGRYWADIAPENVVGTWTTRKGQYGEETVLVGAFDRSSFDRTTIEPMPEDDAQRARMELEALLATEAEEAGDEGDVLAPVDVQARQPRNVGRLSIQAINRLQESDRGWAEALDVRISSYMDLMRRDSSLAEMGRQELVLDLQDYLQVFPNPHEDPGTAALSSLRTAVGPTGINPTLLRPFAVPTDRVLPSDASLLEVIAHFSATQGSCRGSDCEAAGYSGDPTEVIGLDVGILFDGSGAAYFEDWDTYLTGDLYRKLDNVQAALNGEVSEDLQAHLLRQKEGLLSKIETASMEAAGIGPRSGCVPPDCLQDWLREAVVPRGFVEGFTLTVEIQKGMLRIGVTAEENRAHKLAELSKATRERRMEQPWLRYLYSVSAYWNRQSSAYPIVGETTMTRVAVSETIAERFEAERAIESDFQTWLAGSEKWRPIIEAAFQRASSGYVPKAYSSAPIPLVRWDSESVVLDHHQNSGIRKATDTGRLLYAWNVGYGKTFGGLATIAYWRQLGRVRRPLIVVPNSVVTNWVREVRRALPNYRIAVIGDTLIPDPKNPKILKAVPDSDAVRKEKWTRFQKGYYDLLICPESRFTADVGVRAETIEDVTSDMFWIERDEGEGDLRDEQQDSKIQLIRDELALWEAPLSDERDMYAKGAKAKERGRARRALAKQVRLAEGRPRIYAKDWYNEVQYVVTKERKRDNNYGYYIPNVASLAVRQTDSDPWFECASFEDFQRFVWERGAGQYQIRTRDLDYTGQPGDLRITQTRLLLEKNELSEQDKLEIKNYHQTVARLKAQIEQLEAKKAQPKKGKKSSRKLDKIRQKMEDEFTKVSEKVTGSRFIVWWEELGVDCIVVDEAHRFKNLWAVGDRHGEPVAFLGATDDGSSRAWSLYIKVLEMLQRTENRNILLLTGTPIKNSPVEVYSLLSYLGKDLWASHAIRSPEEFVDQFLQIEADTTASKTTWEWSDQGSVKAFKNLDGLRSILSRYQDRRMDPLPSVRIPKANLREVPMEVDRIQSTLTEAIRALVQQKMEQEKQTKSPKESAKVGGKYALLSMDIMSKLAVDPRLLVEDWNALPAEEAKAAKLAGELREKREETLNTKREILEAIDGAVGFNKIAEFYNKNHTVKYRALAEEIRRIGLDGAHVVFIDYIDCIHWCKAALAELLQVPPARIAVFAGGGKPLSPADRQNLVDGVNGVPDVEVDGMKVEGTPPKYDIIIGTSIMEEGVNLQRRTRGIHHLTFPWEPATLVQRNGRGVRQGNIYDSVDVCVYVTPKSFDAFRMNEILGKVGWQKSLFDDRVTTMVNPAVEVDRVELLIRVFCPEDEVEGRLATYHAAKQAREQAKLVQSRERNHIRFQGAVATLERAQRTQRADPLLAAAQTRQAHSTFAALRRASPDEFPNPSVIDRALEGATIFRDAQSGQYAYRGQRIGDVKVVAVAYRGLRFRRLGSWTLSDFYPTVADMLQRIDEKKTWSDEEDVALLQTKLPEAGELAKIEPEARAALGTPQELFQKHLTIEFQRQSGYMRGVYSVLLSTTENRVALVLMTAVGQGPEGSKDQRPERIALFRELASNWKYAYPEDMGRVTKLLREGAFYWWTREAGLVPFRPKHGQEMYTTFSRVFMALGQPSSLYPVASQFPLTAWREMVPRYGLTWDDETAEMLGFVVRR